jgi:hypothetical protein
VNKKVRKLVDLAIILYSVGIVIGFQIIAGAIAVETLFQLGAAWDRQMLRLIFMICLNFLVITPLSLPSDLSFLRRTSLFSPLALTIIALIAAGEFAWYYEEHHMEDLILARVDANIFS